jgi:hypothetical protein
MRPGCWGAGAGLLLVDVRGWAAVVDHVRARARMWGDDGRTMTRLETDEYNAKANTKNAVQVTIRGTIGYDLRRPGR